MTKERLINIIEDENAKMELVEKHGSKVFEYSFEYKGYQCEIIRHQSLGHLCGYIYLKQDDEMIEMYDNRYDVHGGITYTDTNERKIGFDCAHYMDLNPSMFIEHDMGLGGTYRSLEFVINEVKKMVNQTIEIKEDE